MPAPFVAEILAAKPIAYWRMTEPTGNAAIDSSPNGLNGLYEQGVSPGAKGPASSAFGANRSVHRAAQFSGGRMTANLAGIKSFKSVYSVELWFWKDDPNEKNPAAQYLFSRGAADDKDTQGDHLGIGESLIGAGPDLNGRLFFSTSNDPNSSLIGHSILASKTWNHVVLVREGRRVTVYLNGGGEPEISGDADITYPLDSSHIFIGGRCDHQGNFIGRMDEVALFDRVLQRDEISRQFRAAGVEVQAALVPGVSASGVKPTPPTPADASIGKLHVQDGFQAELVVSEPLVTDPIAIAWGPDGKLWVVEMTDYPLGKHGRMDPSGRVIYLEDTHGDGKYDKATVFADNLNFPNGILPWRNGVIVTAAPEILYLESTTGTGMADKKEVLYSGFTEANPQLRINCPTYGLDNWIYLANGLGSRGIARSTKTGATVNTSGHDVRIRPDDGSIELETGLSQYGRRMDDCGNWLGVDNSNPVRQFVIPERYAQRNPLVQLPRGADEAGLLLNPKVYPVSSGQKRYGYAFFAQAGHFTSACSIVPYRDNLLFDSPQAAGDDQVFICEPAHNLVQHLVLNRRGSSFVAQRAEKEPFNDFLASEDLWCRPVFLAGGPDGALWMVDMYRYFIDHPDFLPPEGRQDLRPYYRLGEDRGRIYRIYPNGKKPRAIPRLDTLDTAALVGALESPSGWQRDMIRMMLVWRKDPAAIAPLENLVQTSPDALTRMHALCALDGLGKLRPEILGRALHDQSPPVRRQAIRLAETRINESPELIDDVVRLTDDPDPSVRLQLAFTLGEWDTPRAGKALANIALNAGDDLYLSAAVMSSASHHYDAIADALIAAKKAGPITRDLLGMALAKDNRDLAARLLEPILSPRGGGYDIEQMESFSRFLDGLPQHHTTLAKLAGTKKDALSDRLDEANSLFDFARHAAIAGDRPAEQRIAATALLGRQETHLSDDLDLLASLLNQGVPPQVQLVAIHTLAHFDRPEIPARLTHNWRSYPAEVRAAVLDATLSREPWAFELLMRIEARDLSAVDIDPIRRQRWTRHASQRVRELAQKTIGAESSLSRTKVVEEYHPVFALTGDASRGAKVFSQNCVTCHHLANMGNEIGPNLQSVAGWKSDALLTAILDPSLSAEPRYLSYNCAMDTGEVVYGLLVRESAAGVVMKGLDAKERTIPRRQVKSLECTNRSLMPEGFESAIDKQSMADLIRFLQSQGQAESR